MKSFEVKIKSETMEKVSSLITLERNVGGSWTKVWEYVATTEGGSVEREFQMAPDQRLIIEGAEPTETMIDLEQNVAYKVKKEEPKLPPKPPKEE